MPGSQRGDPLGAPAGRATLVHRTAIQSGSLLESGSNIEEQYSIWPADRENPAGRRDAGKSGPKAECLAWVKEVWTDMRPLSLGKAMEGTA